MKIVAEPQLNQWQPGQVTPGAERAPVIATGHQAALWHPGILAKDIAMAIVARRVGGSMVHLVVDSDVHETMRVDVPVVKGDRLSAVTVQLAPVDVNVPTGMQPAVDVGEAIASLEAVRGEAAVDVGPLIDALRAAPQAKTLAEQAAGLTTAMMRPYVGEVTLRNASGLLCDADELIEAMLQDARGCVMKYNRAAAAHPQAGIAPLMVEHDRVELPLWQLAWSRPRTRVFADLADSKPLLTDVRGEVIEDRLSLAPRALLLTAVMRSRYCDLFIHGRGGYVYDRITEAWWKDWRGEALAPMTLASADMYLDFDVPVSDTAQLARARWWAHHLPHNVDRHVAVDDVLARRKRDLLAHMGDDRDVARRAATFAEIHRINSELATRSGEAIAAAGSDVARARVGLKNRAIAGRRYWFFGFYPKAKLEELRIAAG